MEKIKVLHVVNSLDPGGMENGVVNLIAALSADFEFQVACLKRRGLFAERLPKPGNVCVLGKKSGFSLQAAMRLAVKISQLKPDVIHTHNLGPLIYSSLATLGGLVKPILHGEHSQLTEEECSPRRLRQRRFFYNCCRQVHTVSLSQRDELIGKGFSRICSVVNGVDGARFIPGSRAEAKEQNGLPQDSLVMGMVGRFGPFKRHSVLLDAFDALGGAFPKLHLLIIGAGGHQELIVRQQAEQLEMNDRIHFAGFQTELSRFYQAMDFLIVPSVNEGLSNAILEAMACGIPILAHTACGSAGVVSTGSEGMVTDLGSSEKIRQGVHAMVGNKAQFPLWGRNARGKAVRDYSLDSMVNGYANLYRSMVAPH